MVTFRASRASRVSGLLALVVGLALAACAPAAAPPPSAEKPAAPAGAAAARAVSPAEVPLYRGADRQKVLEEGARKEGKLVWYTTSIVDQLVRPQVDAFKKKYPFLEVEFFRANSSEIGQRAIQEHQAGRYEVDIANGTDLPSRLREAGIGQPFYSPALDAYPAELKDKDGFWGAEEIYFLTLGYNTRLVSKQDVPRTYEDLLDPKWKGKILWSTSVSSGGPKFVGNILLARGQEKGMDYLNKLAAQEVRNTDASGRAVLDQVIAGQFPLGLQIFNEHAVVSAGQGAPSAWQALDPTYASRGRTALFKNAPHPHAAMLFLDYVFSEEGQQAIRQADGIPAHPKVEAREPTLKPDKGGFKANFIDPEEDYRMGKQWGETFTKLFLR